MMVNPVSVLQSVRSGFAADSYSDINFIYTFTGAKKACPLMNTTVAIEVGSIDEGSVKPVFSDDDIPVLQYNYQAEIKIRFDIYVPLEQNGYDCYAVYNRLIPNVPGFFSGSGYTLSSAGCGEISYKRDEGAFLLTGFVTIVRKGIVS